MSNLDANTQIWVLEAKVKALSDALEAMTGGVRAMALTLREWAAAAGGHTPSAIVASKLLQLIGDEQEPCQ